MQSNEARVSQALILIGIGIGIWQVSNLESTFAAAAASNSRATFSYTARSGELVTHVVTKRESEDPIEFAVRCKRELAPMLEAFPRLE